MTIAVGFVILVVAEIYVIIKVAEATSALVTVLLLLATSVAGGALVRREGARAWRRAQAAVAAGRPPSGEVADGALIMLGGALLVPPGFITDALGLLLELPITRVPFRGLLGAMLARRVRRAGTSRFGRDPRRRGRVIQGEVVDEGPPSSRSSTSSSTSTPPTPPVIDGTAGPRDTGSREHPPR